MRSKLHEIIAPRIRENGPMRLDDYMGLCLSHPEYGYYMTRDPFGADGDFTTSPEISQLFGEMIGVWVADLWIKLGKPVPFTLLECGPGRGTLMADILRATKKVDGFHSAAQVALMEISPVLKTIQKDVLIHYQPVWFETLEQISDVPVICIANEFLDALPIRQFTFNGGEWFERAVGLDNNDTLCAMLTKGDFEALSPLMRTEIVLPAGTVVEISPAVDNFLSALCNLICKQGGGALFLDYGYDKTNYGDSLQALKRHRFVSPFEKPGECDLTAHVNFENITRIGRRNNVFPSGPVSQKFFLETMGINIRAENLLQSALSGQAENLRSGLQRLTDPEGMGGLFKVCALCHDEMIEPAGFA